jgi:hypothetical protein
VGVLRKLRSRTLEGFVIAHLGDRNGVSDPGEELCSHSRGEKREGKSAFFE